MRIRLPHALPVVTLAFASTCLFAQNASTISFSGAHLIPYANSASYSPVAYAAGDMTGDGKIDLVLGTTSNVNFGPPPQFQLLKGDGKGVFTSSLLPISAPTVGQLLIADVNKDGHQDLIHVYAGSDTNDVRYDGHLTIYLGDGHGNFHESSSLPLPPGYAGAATAAVADFNHDGKPDILVCTDDANPSDGPYTQTDIFLNHGGGTFTHAQSIFDLGVNEFLGAVGDFNGDGKLDFTIIDNTGVGFRVITGNGDGTFREPQQDTYVFDSAIESMFATDFNHDGRSDLVVSLFAKNSPGAHPRVATLLAKTAGGFSWYAATSIPYSTFNASLADLNADGKLDFLYLDNSSSVSEMRVLQGQGNGKFAASQAILTTRPAFILNRPPLAAPLTVGGRPAIFFTGRQTNGKPYLGVLLNQSQ
jgi:hypothetical protein